MKKNYLLLSFLVFSATCLLSQPTITYNGNAPQIGDVHYLSNNEEMLDPGSAGPNQNWDYSEFNVTSTAQATIMAPGSTPFGSDFPECNQVFHFDGTSTYMYYDLTQNEINHYGEGFDVSPPYFNYYTDPRKEIEYPFSFNNSFTDTWQSTFEYEGLTTKRSGTYVITADAWGSLTTPEDTYGSVLRTNAANSQVDSVWMDGIFVYATATLFTHYSWHTASSHTPVMAISFIETNFGTSYSNHYTTSSAFVRENSGISDLKIFPNPATDAISVSFSSADINMVKFTVIDLTGKLLISEEKTLMNSNTQMINLPVNDLPPGLYFLQIEDKNTSVSKKIVIN